MHAARLAERTPRRRFTAGAIMIGLTLVACGAAIVFRTPLRSRYWAGQLVRARSMEQRAVPLAYLCNAGDAGRWGIAVLLEHPDAEVRQYGVVVLQHVRTDWSRRRLLEMLNDASTPVRELAALGLAIHGDASVVPELKRMYVEGDPQAASAACMALERLAVPEAVAALAELAEQPAEAAHRAALVEALQGVGNAECAAVLLELLGDHRPCHVPMRAQRLLERFAPLAREYGIGAPAASRRANGSTGAAPAPRTIAERAAAALSRITGLSPPFASNLPAERREAAERVWRDWLAESRPAP
jgi:HEAT repeat protein